MGEDGSSELGDEVHCCGFLRIGGCECVKLEVEAIKTLMLEYQVVELSFFCPAK